MTLSEADNVDDVFAHFSRFITEHLVPCLATVPASSVDHGTLPMTSDDIAMDGRCSYCGEDGHLAGFCPVEEEWSGLVQPFEAIAIPAQQYEVVEPQDAETQQAAAVVAHMQAFDTKITQLQQECKILETAKRSSFYRSAATPGPPVCIYTLGATATRACDDETMTTSPHAIIAPAEQPAWQLFSQPIATVPTTTTTSLATGLTPQTAPQSAAALMEEAFRRNFVILESGATGDIYRL
jgi:hypothetical protein